MGVAALPTTKNKNMIAVYKYIPVIWMPTRKLVKKYGDQTLKLKCHSKQCTEILRNPNLTNLDLKQMTEEYLAFHKRVTL
jgi:hypothetical protein